MAPHFVAERRIRADAGGVQALVEKGNMLVRERAEFPDLAELAGAQFLRRPPLRLLKLKQHGEQRRALAPRYRRPADAVDRRGCVFADIRLLIAHFLVRAPKVSSNTLIAISAVPPQT